MKPATRKPAAATVRCAIYTRKSTEEGLEQEFNSLDAQRESAENYIASQKTEGWIALPHRYDDGGYTGGNMERPALKRLLDDVGTGGIDCVVVYKLDRLSRSLMDSARILELFEKHRVSFVSVTQQFNTTHSAGRLMLNMLLSFAQFEREIISERTRDKIAATRRKGKWLGGMPILGYDVDPNGGRLVVDPEEAERVRAIFELYLAKQSLIATATELNGRGWTTKRWRTRPGHERGGRPFDKCGLRGLLTNVAYLGKVRYKDEVHAGEQSAIVDHEIWQQAQLALRANGRTGGMHIRNKYGALLKGLLFCKPCGCAMGHTYTLKKGNCAYRYYVCYTAQKRGWHACPSKSLPAEQIEQFVVDQIRGIGRDPALRAAVIEKAAGRVTEASAAAQRELRVVERDLARLGTEIRDAVGDAATDAHAASRLADLNERYRLAERRRAESMREQTESDDDVSGTSELEAALASFDPVWRTLSPNAQAHVLRLLIRRVDYDGAQGTISLTFHDSGIRALGQPKLTAEAVA